jgi:hypothetical protein
MATAANEATIERLGNLRFRVWWLVGLSVLAAAVVAVATFGYGSDPAAVTARDYPARTSMLYSPDEMIVKRLAAGGQIPSETLNSRSFVIKGLINRGLVPRDTLDDRATLIDRLVNQGHLPVQAADSRATDW